MFAKIDVFKNFASFTGKYLCWSLFLIKLQVKFLRTASLTEHLQCLFLWFMQQNNLIFSVTTMTLCYNQKLSWKYCNYYHPPYIKISIFYQKSAHSSPNILQTFMLNSNFMILPSIFFCTVPIFLRGEWLIP